MSAVQATDSWGAAVVRWLWTVMLTRKADASSTRVIWRYQRRRAADLIVIESEGEAVLQVLCDVPTASDSLHHGGQGRVGWRSGQVMGKLIGVVEAAVHEEPMATIRDTSMHHRQASPVKKALPFAAQARRVAVPLPGTERLLCNAGYADSAGGRCGSVHRPLRWRGRPARRHSLAPPTTLATRGSGRRPYRPPPSGWASE